MNLAPSFSLLSTSYKPRPVKVARLHSLGKGADALCNSVGHYAALV